MPTVYFEDLEIGSVHLGRECERGFGGQPERTYNRTVPVSLRSRIWLPL